MLLPVLPCVHILPKRKKTCKTGLLITGAYLSSKILNATSQEMHKRVMRSKGNSTDFQGPHVKVI